MGSVVLRRSSLGDVVLLGAVTGQLPGPVTLVCDPAWHEVALRLPGVKAVVDWPRGADPRDVAGALPEGDLYDLQGSWRSALVVAASGRSARRIHKHTLRRRLGLLVPGLGARETVPTLYARAAGVEVASGPWISLLRSPNGTLLLVPGASSATKRWSPERFAELASTWKGPVAALGGPGDEVLLEPIRAARADTAVWSGRGFAGVWPLLERASVVVGNDTGLTHLSGACGVPVVTVFGSTDPRDGFAPWRGEVVQRSLVCRPCSLHGRERCPRGGTPCLDISASAVLHAAVRCAGMS